MNKLRYAINLLLGLLPLVKAGMIRPMMPHRLIHIGIIVLRFGFTPTGLIAIASRRAPQQTAIIDDWGSLNYAELVDCSHDLARGLVHFGLGARNKIGILARNHRYFPILLGAAGKVGFHIILLNTGASASQLRSVIQEQKIKFLIADTEFSALIQGCNVDVPCAFTENLDKNLTVNDLMTSGRAMKPQLPLRPKPAKTVVLTSGTTGTPKGAQRPEPRDWLPASALLSKFPLRQHQSAILASPLFHTWGLATLQINLALCSTMIMERFPKPVSIMQQAKKYQVEAIYVISTVLQRITESSEALHQLPLPHLRVLAASGSAITEHTIHAALDAFGAVIYNFYGTTEVAWATIATPIDLMKHPRAAGKVPFGTQVRVLDENYHEVAPMQLGKIFVNNGFVFEGYTRAGEDKERYKNLISTGDLGYFNAEKILFVEGRQDDMIVSGGENVFPLEVENTIGNIPGVLESAVIGVKDQDFGQRLIAFVVLETSAVNLTAEDIQNHVRQHLSRFCIPREVFFIAELPRNATGKVIPALLQELHAGK